MHANSQVFEAGLEQLSGLVRRERSALVGVAVREGLTREEALESVQDALVTFLRRARGDAGSAVAGGDAGSSAAEGDEAREPVAVLKRMVRNAARNGRRRHHRLKPHLPIEKHDPGSRDEDVERLLSQAETSLQLQSCVRELREVERAVVTLRLLEERSGEDVAQLLGLSRAHVDVLVYRAKATLRVCMGEADCTGR